MDAPKDGETHGRRSVLAGGWVIDNDGLVEYVDVTINRVVVDRVPVVHDRPDISSSFPDSANARRAGWTTFLDLSTCLDDVVEVVAYAVRPDGGRWSIGRALITIAAAPPHSGEIIVPRRVEAGYHRIYGTTQSPSGVSSIEMVVDGVSAGRARIALPSGGAHAETADEAIGAFEFVHNFRVGEDGTPRVARLGARVETLDGHVFALPDAEIEIEPSVDRAVSPERMDKLFARIEEAVRSTRSMTDIRPARMLVVTHDLSLGGGQLYLQELLIRLAGRGIQFDVVSLSDGVLRTQLEELGAPVHITGAWPVDDPEAYEGRIAEFLAWAGGSGYSTMIANTMLAFPAVDAASRMHIPVVWAIHESFDLDQFWMEAHVAGHVHEHVKARARHALSVTAHAIFEAAATLELYAPYLAAGAGQVVPYGVDLTEIDAYRESNERGAVRRKLGIDEGTTVLLCLGTIEPRKAQLMLTQAFGSVAGRGACELVLVGGKPSSYLDALNDYVTRTGLEDVVRVVPVMPDINQWYLAADVFVCASDVESLPRSIIEAMAFDTPVLSTAVFGIPELITDGETGWLCEPRSTGAMRDRMEHVLSLTAEARRIVGERGGRHVRERHAPEIYVDVIAAQLEDLVAPPS